MQEDSSVRVDFNVAVPMRDGIILYADIYRPEGLGPFPVLLQRTPYDKSASRTTPQLDPLRAARAGYAVVVQDTRGRHSSEGEFYCFRDEIPDGFDTVEWAAAQPWSSGKVGMFGSSYVGATQWLAAIAKPPHLAAIVPNLTASNYHDGWTYQGGAFELGFNVSWALGPLTLANFKKLSSSNQLPKERRRELIDAVDSMESAFLHLPTNEFPHLKDGLAEYFYDWLAHPDYDDYWKQWCIEEHHSKIRLPAYNLGGWYDIFLGGTIRNYAGMRQNGATKQVKGSQKLLIGPWQHVARGTGVTGDHYFGVAANALFIDLDGIHLRWFDYWLKGIDNGIMTEPPVKIFVMGDDVWRDEAEWPLPLCCNAYFMNGGAFDQREVETREDVLVYSTPVLEQDLEVTGPITVTLSAASSASDTDFTAKLMDVCEKGCARNLTDGIIRARYRESSSTPRLISPGDVYSYTIDLGATSNVFKRGHRIRLEVSSSNFPRFDRNTNTGKVVSTDGEPKPALQTILHNATHPSRVTLPIVPR